MLKKIEHMMQLQDEMNTVVHPQWKEQNFNWCRAAWVECAEMMDHIGWKWWKKQEPNIEQAKLELVDIWHFILSTGIDYGYSASFIVENAAYSTVDKITLSAALRHTEKLATSLLASSYKEILGSFSDCCKQLSLSPAELYKLYIGKNVLNKFRQANGYKQGTYIKIWFGKEDNDYLYELLGLLDSDHEDFMKNIEKSLTNAYITVVEANSDL